MARIQFSEALPLPQAWHKLRRKNKTELPSCKWRECGLPSQREKRHAPAAMTIERIKCRSYLLLPQSLPQPLSKLLPFPAILFVRPPSVRISLGGGIPPRISGTVLMTVPRGNNHLSRRDVPENKSFAGR